MALILQLETSTISCSVALSLNGKTIALKELSERNAHASHLTLFVEDVLKQCNKTMHNIDAVAVSMGPGSYTGLRIGVSTAKGFCYALDIPLIAINTLESMAYGLISNDIEKAGFYCPMIDARRMEVYTATYDSALNEVRPTEALVIDENSFEELFINDKIVFFGDGAFKCSEVLTNKNAIFISDFVNSAKDLSGLAFRKYQTSNFEDVAYFEPYYLKDFVATQAKKIATDN